MLIAAGLLGCAQSAHQTGQYVFDKEVPKEIRRQVDWSVSFPELKAAPSAYEGRTVALGGVILGAKRAKDRTEIEVMQLPLERGFTPSGDRHSSQGRFLAVQADGLDPATIQEGTPVTVVGQVAGTVTKPLDESDYTYPVVEIQRLVDWAKAESPRYYGSASYPYAPYYGYYPYRFWGYSPYWSPYGPYSHPYFFGPSRAPSTPSLPPPSAIPPQFKKDD